MFVRGSDNALYHKWQNVPSGAWSAWASEGGVLTSDIAVGQNADGRLEVFVRGTDNALWHKWQGAPALTPSLPSRLVAERAPQQKTRAGRIEFAESGV